MHTLTLRQLHTGLKNKEFSSIELTQYFLQRINQYKEINAFISIDPHNALKNAENADNLIKNDKQHILTGIPMAHKDIFCTQEMSTTCGSKMLANFQAPYDATIVHRLKQQGAVLVGKTNMDEFAMGSSNENSYFGAVKNPWNVNYVPGGSSGGSAAAVAMGLVPYATGSDTGGSIRQPAAFCSISGLKPTYGLVSRFGMVAFASSLDQAGPMAHTVEDLAYILQAMAGPDPQDSTCNPHALADLTRTLDNDLPKLRIGLPTSFLDEAVDEDIQKATKEALAFFKNAGAEIIELNFELQPLWVPCYYVIACAEASSNLSRFDGIRYGYRSQKEASLRELIANTRSEAFGMEVKRRILTGTFVLSSGYFDAYYVQAQKVRRMIQNELQNSFKNVDLIIGPTTPTCAFKIGEKVSNPTQRYLADIFTVGANLAGLPALSIPAGFNKQGLPIGLQLMGAHFNDAFILQVGHFLQKNTHWHNKKVFSNEVAP
ncbi:aspartyl/glutamyl-tRNA amidotransferase subunit A (plasmid) [Legionella adelaidensis]|uniref:Glutamyl-tRNA(Gln) amidotransferase subunit A n=1 Tax=Legionella adelaidensis TaxID=45056 RepID=A0A0W0R4H8_9GAMM|nr:Asp-tRNA(Asn)/Glu-tRNA(Gln) amidotransferase subunit GatA [Legionella adelaidensis]KTC65918.1 aspartyl/glutamyl-tRNA amidotransferase subunit A [Legionella adelaidensis]VEH85538.1 aspartyl/glutamyl-tRNA amidotransferase subunit A [Legionella adelaidensis]